MLPRPMAQTMLFEEVEPHPLPHLPQDVQIHLLQQMVQWMQGVAVAINTGEHDEQDRR
jgi:hypothetical protein